jgi:hypothetical protein
MSTLTPRQLGKNASKLLHERLIKAGILDGLYSRILGTMPAVVQEAGADETGSQLAQMFQATASQYAMCFGCARLAVRASTLFTKRVLGLFPVSDKSAWGEFTEGVLEYATDSMRHPATRGDIIEDINDHQNAVARLCQNYPPEAAPVLRATAKQIERSVSEVLASLDR